MHVKRLIWKLELHVHVSRLAISIGNMEILMQGLLSRWFSPLFTICLSLCCTFILLTEPFTSHLEKMLDNNDIHKCSAYRHICCCSVLIVLSWNVMSLQKLFRQSLMANDMLLPCVKTQILSSISIHNHFLLINRPCITNKEKSIIYIWSGLPSTSAISKGLSD